MNRCRVRAANLKPGVAIFEGFYRDFFPGLTVCVGVQDLRVLNIEWLTGDADTVVSRLESQAEPSGAPRKCKAIIEDVMVGKVRVEWLAQVPLQRGASSEQPPSSDGVNEHALQLLLGEAECSSRWALGDRLRVDGRPAEVCSVETFVDVRWQDDALSVRIPARELQLCNPDAFSFFPSELICQRVLDDATGGAGGYKPPGSSSASAAALQRAGGGEGGASARGAGSEASPAAPTSERTRREEMQQPRVGYVVKADPASRMVNVRWLEENGQQSAEEEWSAFDLQIDPEFGYRLGDAVIRSRDWEDPGRASVNVVTPAPAPAADENRPDTPSTAADAPLTFMDIDEVIEDVGPRVGQVAALEAGVVRVRWVNGEVSLHAPRELYRVGDEEEASVGESELDRLAGDVAEGGDQPSVVRGGGASPAAGAPAGPSGIARASATPAASAIRSTAASKVDGSASGSEAASAGPNSVAHANEAAAPAASNTAGMDAVVVTDGAKPAADAAGTETAGASPAASAEAGVAKGGGEDGAENEEVRFEDMAWDPLPTDHHFIHSPAPPSGPSSRQFMRRVQREWQILQRGLPRGVWVHVYPDRMELLRACLVGPEGTPYSEALFFFDVHLPPTYPQVPPAVRFWSFGENLNPNLYENGKVCLSLLGTWSGKDSETWSPERSNLLQVLVSILGLVLNTEPYYNEPGFERERDTPQGELRSQRYNESVALSSYHLMLRVLRSPPSDFAHLAKRHFAERRTAILERARSLQRGESEGSEGFRKSLAALLPRLQEALPQECPP